MKLSIQFAFVFISLLNAACSKESPTTAPASQDLSQRPQLVLVDTSGTGNYFVRWTRINGALSFLLQESTEPTFSSPTTTYSGTDTLIRIAGKPFNTAFFYRVRANLSQTVSPWSDVKAVVVAQRPTPHLLLTVSQISFGQTYVDSFTTQNVTIRNSGSATLHILSVSITNPLFTTNGPTISIPAAGSGSIQFVYSPISTGTDTAIVIVYSDDPDDFPSTIKLSGTAITSSLIRWSSMPNLPIPLSSSAGAAIGSKIYVIGGFFTSASSLTFVFDTLTQVWSQLAPMSIARADFAAGAVGGKVYAVGGRDSQNDFISLLEEYDPNLNTWTSKAPMPTPRAGHRIISVGAKLYVIGGYSLANNGARIQAVEAYDPASNSWQSLASMPTGRNAFGICTDGAKIWALGGYGSTNIAFEEYAIASNQWTRKADMPTARGGCGSALYNQVIYAFGGSGSSASASSIDEYNISTNKWIRTRTPMLVGKQDFVCVTLGRSIFILGGSTSSCEKGVVVSQP